MNGVVNYSRPRAMRLAVADALLDERRELTELGNQFVRVRV
jgi:hypothetical protein